MADYVSPHWDRAALLVIDVQQDFLDEGSAPVRGTSDVLDAIKSLIEGFRSAGLPIAHIVRLYDTETGDVDLVRRADLEERPGLVAPGTEGSQLVQHLFETPVVLHAEQLLSGAPQVIGDNEIVLFKPRWSAFYRTHLESWLRDHGVDTVVVAGCNLPNCPRATLFDASARDFRTALAVDAVSQSTPERLADLARLGVTLAATEAIRSAIDS